MFRASLCPSSGEQDVCYCMWCATLVLLDVVGSGCGALPCRVRAPQPLPTTSSRTRYVANFTLNLHPLYQPAHHRHTSPSAPNNTCTTHPSHQTGTTRASVHPLQYTRPGMHTIHIPIQHHDTPTCTPHSHIHTRSHLVLLRYTTQRRH